jgi:hypothetical protein
VGQVLVFISPRNRVAQLYPRALGSLFVVFYDSQGYGGGILSRLHTGYINIVVSNIRSYFLTGTMRSEEYEKPISSGMEISRLQLLQSLVSSSLSPTENNTYHHYLSFRKKTERHK